MALQDLKTVPQWYDFRERYQLDIVAFAIEALDMTVEAEQAISWQQEILFESICLPSSRTSVASGHGTGKSRSAGVVALWHLLCFPDSITMFTAPQIGQLRKIVWKEIAICYDRLKNGVWGWLADYVVILAELVYIKGYDKTWHVLAKTAPKHQPTNIAGQHGDNYLLWVDEASGVDDAVMEVVMGALTHPDNKAVLTSQPTRNAGFFYDTHHKLSHRSGGVWRALTFNGEQSPLVSEKVLRELFEKYGSRDDAGYMIRVRGLFPDLTGEFLLSNTQADDMYVGNSLFAEHDDFGFVITVDVGGGVGRDDSVIVVAKVWGEAHWAERARRVEVVEIPLCKNTDNIHELTGIIDNAMANYPNASLVIDANGAGRGLAQHLTAKGIFYTEVHWGGQCFSNDARSHYANKRSQAIVCMTRAAASGRLKIMDNRHKVKITEQITRLPYSFDDHTRFWVMPKEQMKTKRGLKSPDVADALAFLFLDGIYYVSANEGGYKNISAEVADSFDDMESMAETAFA